MNWSKFDRGIFLVNCLGIVYHPKNKKILIGRREKDTYIKKLTWCFPGGRPSYDKSLEESLKRKIRTMTGLNVDIKKIIFAKTYPEKREFLSIYYHCEVISGTEKAGELFKEIKWIKPNEVKKYFTTSIHPNILSYLTSLK